MSKLKTFLASVSLVAMAVSSPVLAQEAAPVKMSVPASEDATQDYVMLTINGEDISKAEFDVLWREVFAPNPAPDFNAIEPDMQKNILLGLVSERAVYDAADAQGIVDRPSIKAAIEKLTRQLVVQTYLQEKNDGKLTDDKLRAMYEKKMSREEAKTELRARHILVESQEDAKEVYHKLKTGTDFAELAKEKSTDTGSGAKGGELGWFAPDNMVPEFSQAAMKLSVGEISKPVKSPFGYHIIELEERRTAAPRPFEQVKPLLLEEAQQEANRQAIMDVLQKADIKWFAPDGTEKPFPRTFPK